MKPSLLTIQKRTGFTSRIKNRRKTRPAETLIEVIMAIFIVATGSAAATSLIVSAVQSNSFSRDNLIALNLAVEGVEAVRNIRDTNWLKFGFDKENCWNMDPRKDTCAETDTTGSGDLIQPGNYRLDLEVTTMRWLLTLEDHGPGGTALNLDDTTTTGVPVNNEYQLKYFDLNKNIDSDGDSLLGNDHDLYVSGAPPLVTPAVVLGDSPFYRMVQVEYTGTSTDPTTSYEMLVTSVVQWRAQNHANKVEIKTKLTNYQKVKVT